MSYTKLPRSHAGLVAWVTECRRSRRTDKWIMKKILATDNFLSSRKKMRILRWMLGMELTEYSREIMGLKK